MGEVIDHPMMNFDEPENVQVQVKKDDIALKPPPMKAAMTENKEYRADVSWPSMKDLEVPASFIDENEWFYKAGMNRQRQKQHGAEIPKRRNPDLIITGAKKCGTTALKIFMNFHNSFQDTPGERHFFNRPSNWEKGYDWYHDSMPLVYEDEICYEKTPDYFDRPFVPERMSKLDNAQNVKFVHVLCDPVRRSFSHFNHMFTVQATGQGGVGQAQPGFEFLNANFGDIPREEAFEKTVELAFKNMLGGRDPNDMTDDEIRASINEYYTRWDLPPKDPKRVYPLRIPDAVLGGSLYSIHIRTYLHYFSNDNMLYLDATELLENPGLSLRRVANFAGVPALIDENNFYFDDAKGYFCMTPPVESGRESFCLGSSKGRTKSDLPDALKAKLRRFYKPFVEDLTNKYSGATYEGWNW